ncbi:MAG: protein kinase [Ignavibacteriae bacterium]|nr:protein kinase [Ignavibacteriota bacterium]
MIVEQTISHYKIVGKLGEGGMGVVYKAEDTNLHRLVALKFLPEKILADEEQKTRFAREAQIAATLNHPNIATIYEYDNVVDPATSKERVLIAMEYVEGETLKERISRGPLSVSKTVSIIVQIAHGLQAAHNHGVTHRDIKPANIIITNDGTAKILDFGIAKPTGASDITKAGNIVGSVAYMSPEQIAGETVDERSDIWSLGVLMFEMLTQHHPFRGEHPTALVYSITNEEPLELSQFQSGIPKAIQVLCRRCLEKDKNRRPQSMMEILELLGETPWFVFPIPEILNISKRKRRILGAASGIVLVSVLVWWFFIKPQPPPEPKIWKIGILPFQNLTDQKNISDWPKTVQSRFGSELSSFEDFRVYDPSSLNSFIESSLNTPEPQRSNKWYEFILSGGIRLIVDGNIIKSRDGYGIQLQLIDPKSREIIHTSSATAKGEEDLPRAIQTLSQAILDYIYVKILHQERVLEPWLQHRRPNWGAQKAFQQAYERVYSGSGFAKYCRIAIELDSTFVSPRIWLISNLVQKGNIQEANEHYLYLQKIEDTNPFEAAMINWAGAFIQKDIPSQARYLEMALEHSPGNNILLYNLALDHFIMQDYHAAIKVIMPAIEMKWKFSWAHYLLGASYNQLKKYNQAREVLEQALSIKPVDRDIYGLLSLLSYRDHDITKAQRYEHLFAQRSKEMGDSLWSAYAALAELNLEEELYGNAVRLYRAAISLKPASAEYHSKLAEILYKAGDLDVAKTECLEALRLDSMWINAYFTLAQIFEQTGDTVQALSHYHAYLRKDSSNSTAESIKQRLSILSR